jgi:hypothetical protein
MGKKPTFTLARDSYRWPLHSYIVWKMAGAKARGPDRTIRSSDETCCGSRRRTAPVKQEDFAAFAVNVKVDRLRQSVGVSVAGVFFAKIRYQVGALRSGQHEGVTFHRIPLSLG